MAAVVTSSVSGSGSSPRRRHAPGPQPHGIPRPADEHGRVLALRGRNVEDPANRGDLHRTAFGGGPVLHLLGDDPPRAGVLVQTGGGVRGGGRDVHGERSVGVRGEREPVRAGG
ncbi:hypothetical protein [Streptomyces sp. NBC_01320]|uniref:hypothetical protein n=1 Tax=Streptomyces sp. NBC_01320 TaxID=2903824 RepID=UPI002E12086C